jgi:hypothetical protein
MPTPAEIVGYLWTVGREWWIIVPLLVGAIRLYEWLFRHGQPLPIFSPRARWYIALAGVVLAQFVAFLELQRGSKEKLNSLTTASDHLKQDKAALEATVKAMDKQISDLSKQAKQPRTSNGGPDGARLEVLRKEMEDRRRRTNVSNRLAQFIMEGGALQDRCIREQGSAAVEAAVNDWFRRATTYIDGAMGQSFVVRFQNISDKTYHDSPLNYPLDRTGVYNGIRGRVERLHEFIRELQPSIEAKP